MIKDELFKKQDLSYREFTAVSVPTINKERIIGVRVPIIRQLAKELNKEEKRDFLKCLPHEYYEEDLLHVILLNNIKDYDETITAIEEFLPYIDNWATNDTLRPKSLNKRPDKLLLRIKDWIATDKEYYLRFAVSCLMHYFLKENYGKEQLKLVADIRNDAYYVEMMNAWYYATALIDHYDDVIIYLKNSLLSIDVHNKTIQKAIDSYRISPEKKEYLRSLRRKRARLQASPQQFHYSL